MTDTQYCPACSEQVGEGALACSHCGRELGLQPGNTETGTNLPEYTPELISWELAIPLVTNRFVLYDLLKLWGLTILVLYVLLFLVVVLPHGLRWPTIKGLTLVVVIIGLAFALISVLVMLLFFQNRYPMWFGLAPRAAAAVGLASWANDLAVLGGALMGSLSVTGAGLLARTAAQKLVFWEKVARMKVHPQDRVISLMNSWRVVVRLYATPENFPQIREAAEVYWRAARKG